MQAKLPWRTVCCKNKMGNCAPSVLGAGLSGQQSKMSATDLELTGMLHAIETYRQFILNGHPFTVLTDHVSLKYIKNLKFSASQKLIRYSLLLENLTFDVVHVKGKENIVPDILSRYPIEKHDSDDDEPEANSLLDVDHFNFLMSIDVEQLMEDFDGQIRDANKPKAKKYIIGELLPISTKVVQAAAQDNQSNVDKPKQKAKRNQKQRDIPAHETANNETDTDRELMEGTEQLYQDLDQQLLPVVDLKTQAEGDTFIAAMINYLQTQRLPEDRELAKRVLFQADDFFISENQLFHLARTCKKKRLHSILPRLRQLYVPV